MNQRFHGWTRDLHLYAGLFTVPLVLIYALSTVMLNHAYVPGRERLRTDGVSRSVQVSVRDDSNSIDVARQVRDAIGVAGEIGFVQRRRTTISFPIEVPGRTTDVRFDFATGVATVELKRTSVWDAMVYLHRMPGPHNVAIRGNWFYTRLWSWVADFSVYLILFLTATGIYLWTVLKADRKAGLIFLGAGAVSFVAIFIAIVA